MDLSSAAALLSSLKQLIPSHLKNRESAATHMPLLTDKLLSGATLHEAFGTCTREQAAGVVASMEHLDSVRGIAAAFAVRAAAAGPEGMHCRDHDALVAHQSAPGGEASCGGYLCGLARSTLAPVCRRQDGPA